MYDGFKPEKCKNQPQVNYKHKRYVIFFFNMFYIYDLQYRYSQILY